MSYQRKPGDSDRPPLDLPMLDSARAWVDGELDASTAEAFERSLSEDPSLRVAVARVSSLRTLLSELPRASAPDRVRADLIDRVRESFDPVASQLRSVKRVSAPADIREALRLRIREEATETSVGTPSADSSLVGPVSIVAMSADNRPLSAHLPSVTTDSPVRTKRVGGGAMRFAAAAVILLSVSALLLSGGRRQPQRPAGAVSLQIEFAQIRPRPSVSPNEVEQPSALRSPDSRTIGGGR